MTTKKKSPVFKSESSKSEPLESDVKKPARSAPIQQVVEVIEDDESLESSSSVSPATETHSESPKVESREETLQTEEVIEEAPEEPKEEESLEEQEARYEEVRKESPDEKRRELVDELFQKRIDRPVEVTPEISTHTGNSRPKPIYSWAIVVTACLVIGASLFYFSKTEMTLPSIVTAPTPTPSPQPIMSPTPTPLPVSKDSLSIQVLNGGGVAGAGSKMKAYLETKGYKVKNTGNADEFDHETTEILVSETKKAAAAMLTADLKDEYKLSETVGTLEESSDYDVRIIVGKE